MKDEIIIRTLMDTEISVLEEFVKKVEDSPKVLEDDKFVSRANFDILKGHLGTLKKMRETGWRNWNAMKNDADIDATTAQPMELEYNGRKFENYPWQFEGLVKERDNWRDMYDQELKKNKDLETECDHWHELYGKMCKDNESLGHRILLTKYDRDMKVEKLKKENEELKKLNDKYRSERNQEAFARQDFEKENEELKKKLSWNEEMLSNRYSDIARLKKENEELSRINSVRLGDINRLQDKVDKFDSLIDTIDRAYPTVYANPLSLRYDENITKFCMTCADILSDWKKS